MFGCVTDAPTAPKPLSAEDVADLVREHGLKRAGARQPIVQYTRELWGRRHFVLQFSTANNAVGYSGSFLGQAWQVLTPLLNAAVYYLIFGVLLQTRRGVHNFIAFLVIGIFIFTFTQTSMLMGARAIHSNVGLTRVLHFPRAVLPLSSTIVALQQLVLSMAVMIPIVLITGEVPSLKWFLLIPAVALQAMFCLGLALIMARIGAKIPDTSQILPFLLRTWLYLSGVFYSIQEFTKRFHSSLIHHALEANPGAVYVELVRQALLSQQPKLSHLIWVYAVFWAVVVLAGGYLYFWLAEESYGRV